MPAENHIRNPFEMAIEQLGVAVSDVGRAVEPYRAEPIERARPIVRRIEPRDLWDALREGLGDLGAAREDVVFAAVIYPIAGLLLAKLLLDQDLLPLLFPLASGFALLGPVAALGVYEISRRREQGLPVTWADELSVLRSPAIVAIVGLGLALFAVFLVWLLAAYSIYRATLGPTLPTSASGFLRDVFTTEAGWSMIIIGVAVGFVFAALTLAISVVSFPLLLDRGGGVGRAVATSIRAVRLNPATMGLWGLIVAAALVLGSIPALVGLIFVMPLLGHATWRLYRKLVVWS